MADGRVPVSVVIPCYQCAPTLRRAVSSVATQASQPTELILVDDGSSDDTPQEIHRLRQEYGEWIHLVQLSSNQGAAAARNAGWNAAKCEYIAFLDADDSWLPRKIDRQLYFMKAHPEFVLTGHAWSRTPIAPSEWKPVTDYAEEWAYTVFSRRRALLRFSMVTPSFMLKRDIPYRFDPGRRHMEDQWFVQELVFAGQGVAILHEVLAVIHKAPFGESGLSAEMWHMERGELRNYRDLQRSGYIRRPALVFLVLYSLAKFVRRLAIAGLRIQTRRTPRD